MHLRWGEAVLILAWLAAWLGVLWWAGVHDVAGLLIPIMASAALPRIFRQLHPAPTLLAPAPMLPRLAGRLLLGVGVVAVLVGATVAPPERGAMTHRVATEEVEAFIAAWEDEHGQPADPEAWEAERAALDRFTEDRARERKLAHERETARRVVARPLGMLGGAALAAAGMALASPRPIRRRRRRREEHQSARAAEAAQARAARQAKRLR